MENPDILASLKRIAKEVESLIKVIKPEECSCHERDSSQVCDLCYRQGQRGHMQEYFSKFCDDCYLWSDNDSCDFCGRKTRRKGW